MFKRSFIILGALFFLSHSSPFSLGTVTLNSLIDEALANNPQIQAAKARYEAAKARVRLLRTLEDPRLEYEYDKITADMDAVMNGKTAPMRTFSVSQAVPFPTKLFSRRQAAEKEANSFEQEYKETERRVVQGLKNAFFTLFLSNKKIRLTEESLDLLKQFVEITEKRYSVNKATQADALRAQVEYSKFSNQLVLLEQEERIAESMVNAFLNRAADAQIGTLEEKNDVSLEINEEEMLARALESRPELSSFKEMVKKSEIDLSLAKQEYLPDFMFKYKREERNGGAGSWAGMVGVTVPLWFWEKQNSFVKEAQANVEVARADYKATENTVLFETRSSFARFEAAKNLVKIYQTGVLPQAQAALETARRGYATDSLGFLDLLDSMRTLRTFQMEYFESLANLEIALADLERAVGVDLNEVQK